MLYAGRGKVRRWDKLVFHDLASATDARSMPVNALPRDCTAPGLCR
jgi:hypothetical protein